jgi:hypothetical protein
MKHVKDINQLHPSLGKFFASSKKKQILHAIKNTVDYKTLCLVADSLSKAIKQIEFTIYGTPIPKSLEELGNVDDLYQPTSLEKEIEWQLLSIRKYSKEIKLFIYLKREFEHFFLMGNYEKANSFLEMVLSQIGYSLWYIEAKFLILEYQNKAEEKQIFLSEINIANKNSLVGPLSKYLSLRTERNLSAYKLDADINGILKYSKGIQEKENRHYYLFRLNFFEHYDQIDYSHVVVFENCNAIVDRYLVLREILRIKALKTDKTAWLYSKCKYLYRKTNDIYFLPILKFINPGETGKEYFNQQYLRIIDLYYSGLYEETITECSLYLKKQINFDILLIHIKSHLYTEKKIDSIIKTGNPLFKQLIEKLYFLMADTENRNVLLYNIYQINKNIISFDIATGLNFYLKKEQNMEVDQKMKLLSIPHFDPYFSQIYLDKGDAIKYLDNESNFNYKSIAIKHWMNYLENKLEEGAVSKEKFLIDNAKVLFKQGEFLASLEEWKNIANLYKNNPPIVQTSFQYWFDCLLDLEHYNEAIALYVDQYFSNVNSVCKIKSFRLIELLRKIRYKGIKRTINLPIFVHINSIDDSEKSFIVEEFLKIFQINRPSELFNTIIDKNPDKVRFFFNEICNTDTLKHSIHINTTIERLTERLNILNYLVELFPTDKKVFQDETNMISEELIIYEGTKKLDESKIYANDQGIINYELNEIGGLFNRYKTIYKLTLKDQKILILAKDSYTILKFSDKENYAQTEVKYTDSALLEVFSELFDLILERYLFSKYGIVAYLSTRIRHGVLLGEIRPEIEKQNLILNRIGSTLNYEESKFWRQNRFGLTEQQIFKLHDALSKFSLQIDNLIENIIKERIQIRWDGKNNDGLFNYEFDKSELQDYAYRLAQESDIKIFCQKVIDLIWERTDANLEVIRSYIQGELKNKFAEALDRLHEELTANNFQQDLPQIFTKIADCSTIIETRLNKISSWFRRSGSSINDFEIERVFDIVWSNTNKCYPKMTCSCDITMEINPVIKSNYYIHLTDIIRIMVDNMFKYGDYQAGIKQFEFECLQKNQYMVLRFKNSKKEGLTELPLITRNGQVDINTEKLISEGKSGINKAIKIVKYDLDNENNYIYIDDKIKDLFVIEIYLELNELEKKHETPVS